MSSVTLDEEALKEYLEKAYEQGWYGCLELKKGAVASLLEEAKKQQQILVINAPPPPEYGNVPSPTYTLNSYGNVVTVPAATWFVGGSSSSSSSSSDWSPPSSLGYTAAIEWGTDSSQPVDPVYEATRPVQAQGSND